jgi:hypothetical protein
MTRGGLIAGLATMSSIFILRNKKQQNQECNYDFVCGNCKSINNCMLPQAALHKHNQKLKKNEK